MAERSQQNLPALRESPLRAPLHELVHQQAQVSQDEAAYEEGKELRRMADAKLEADVRLGRVLEARIFHLASDLICDCLVSGSVSEDMTGPRACSL
jgi:hypothetical protein